MTDIIGGIEVPVQPNNPSDPTAGPSKPRKRFVGSSKPSSSKPRRVANLVPDEILHDPALNAAIQGRLASIVGREWC